MHFNWRTALFLLRLLARRNKDLQHCLMYRLGTRACVLGGGLQKWQAVIWNQTWNKWFLGTYFSVDQWCVKYMYLYKYKVTFKFWCYVCCQILCLKNNSITFLLPVTCRITTIVFYLWVKPPLCIFHWNEESALGYSLQTWCITNTLQKPQWEYHVANQCLPINDLPVRGLETWSDPPCGLLGKTGLLGRFLAVVPCWSLPLKDFCDHLASSQLWQSWLWSFQTSFLFQETYSLCLMEGRWILLSQPRSPSCWSHWPWRNTD